MSTNEYVPSENEVRADFVLTHTRNFDSYMTGRSLTSEQEHYGAQFDAMIARVRRDGAREALAAMEEEHAEKAEKARVGGNPTMHSIELVVAEAARQHRDTRHAIPEESP